MSNSGSGSGGKKGKHTRDRGSPKSAEKEILSDDDSADDICNAIKKEAAMKNRKPFPLWVSKMFRHVSSKTVMWVVVFDRPGSAFPFMKSPLLQVLLKNKWEKMALGNVNHPQEWIETVKEVHIRETEHGLESKFRRSGSDKTFDHVTFVIALPEEEAATFHDVLKERIGMFFELAHEKKRPGKTTLTYAESLLKPGQPKTKGLYGWLVKNVGEGNPDTAVANLTKNIHNHFKDGPVFQYDTHLDKFFVDHDIKKFLEEHVGVTSWDDLSESGRKACFKDYPRRDLPEWENIREETVLPGISVS